MQKSRKRKKERKKGRNQCIMRQACTYKTRDLDERKPAYFSKEALCLILAGA